MLSRRIFSAAAGLLMAGSAIGAGSVPAMAAQPHLSCIAAAAVDIVPSGLGATYTITNGQGFCVQGAPYKGDWSVSFSGAGTASTLICTPIGGGVTGLTITMNMNFHNNLSGVDTNVVETWTQLLPITPINGQVVKISPGNSAGDITTHIFNVCPPAGSPSAYVTWNDNNAR